MNPNPSEPQRIGTAWKEAWTDRRFRMMSMITALLLPVALRSLAMFLNWVEDRPGVVLADPVLRLFQPHDVTWLTFSIIYVGLFAGIFLLLRYPRSLLLAVQTYICMVIARIGAMYLIPLDPPAGAIPLQDPFVQILGTGQLLTKDLFFSGHTSTLFLIGLSMPKKGLRVAYYVAAAAVAFCVLFQHDHYSVDVIAAPFFTYTAYRIAVRLQRTPTSLRIP